jgi:hypothetical protein
LAFHAGRPEDALRLLEELECRDAQGDINVIPFVARANERFLRGEVLTSLGRDAEALQWFASLGKGSVSEVPLLALAHPRLGEIQERGDNRAIRRRGTMLWSWNCGVLLIPSFASWLTPRAGVSPRSPARVEADEVEK